MGRVSCLLILLFSAGAWAIESRNEAGLGYVDNPDYVSANKTGDEYWRLSSDNLWAQGGQKFQVRAGYRGFFKAHQNDLFAWRVGDKIPLNSKWTLNAGLFGNHYVHSSPGVTDESFSNIGADANALTPWNLGRRKTLSLGPGAEVRKYIDVSERTDLTVFGQALFDYEASSSLFFDTFLKPGVLLSSQSDFSRAFIEAGGGVDYNINERWNSYSSLAVQHSSFLSRTVSSETVTTRARGKNIQTRTATTAESYEYVRARTSLSRKLNARWTAGGELTLESQNSTSGFESYSAFGSYVFVAGTF
jgi:hypothetical protein